MRKINVIIIIQKEECETKQSSFAWSPELDPKPLKSAGSHWLPCTFWQTCTVLPV